MLLDPGPDLRDVDVAGDGEHRVARRVVAVEERLRVLERRALEVDEVAVAVVAVGEVVEQQRREHQPREAAVRAVEDVDADLVLHDRDLVVEVLLRHRDAAHAVGLEEQRQLGRRARHDLVVVRVVDVRRAVQRAAAALHVGEVLGLPEARRALEHQVLEQVREAGAALRLAAHADVVVDGDRHDRAAAVGAEHHAQAVVEGEALDGVAGASGRLPRRTGPAGGGAAGRWRRTSSGSGAARADASTD